MASQIQYRRGSNAQNAAFTGALGEITVDTTSGTLRVHDAITTGGSNIATVAYVTAQISALSSNSITDGTSNVKVYSSGNVATSVAGTANVLLVQSTGATITGNLTVTGNITDTGALGINTTSNANITINAGAGFIIASSGILNGQANGVGNIGNTTGYFNTIFAKATSAQYADLAEMYVSDTDYAPGTVVEFGGSFEITQSTASHSPQVAGIISTNPSYLMNATQTGNHVLPVALTGRVPCRVIGHIIKGDRLVASEHPGVATVLDMTQYQPACIIGKALENYHSSDIGIIEVAVGRF